MKREIQCIIIAILIHAGIILAIALLRAKSKQEIKMDTVRIKIADKVTPNKSIESLKKLDSPNRENLNKEIFNKQQLNKNTLKQESAHNVVKTRTDLSEFIQNDEKNQFTEKTSENLSEKLFAQSEPTPTQVQSDNADTQVISSCEKMTIPAKFTGQNLFPRSYGSTWSKENNTVTFIPHQRASVYLDKALERLYVKCVENSGISGDEKPRVIQFIE